MTNFTVFKKILIRINENLATINSHRKENNKIKKCPFFFSLPIGHITDFESVKIRKFDNNSRGD